MSNILKVIRLRRSVREYLDKPVAEDLISGIIEAARLAPSACNSQCWRFIVVNDKEIRQEITKKGLGGVIVPNSWAKTAPVIIVVCADLLSFTHKLGASIKKIQYYLLDVGIAVEHMILRATELGLGTCWIGWFNEKAIKRILKIPKSMKVAALVTLGYPENPIVEEEKDRFEKEKILFWNKYGVYEK